MLRLDTVAEGTLNAVVFWVDLHLDDECTITSGPRPSCLQVKGLGVQQNVWQLLYDTGWKALMHFSAAICRSAPCSIRHIDLGPPSSVTQ